MTLVKILEAPSSDPGKTPRIYTIFLKYLQKNLRSVQRSVSHIEDTPNQRNMMSPTAMF